MKQAVGYFFLQVLTVIIVRIQRGYYIPVCGYEFYLRVLIISNTSEQNLFPADLRRFHHTRTFTIIFRECPKIVEAFQEDTRRCKLNRQTVTF